MVFEPDSEVMSFLTHVQIHFVKDVINHRLLFGEPYEMIRLDRFRQIAVFDAHKIFGYIRWRANQYGTVEWRLFVLKSGRAGLMSQVVGVSPAVKILLSVSGRERMKRALLVIDRIQSEARYGLVNVPESYWQHVGNSLMQGVNVRELPRHYRKCELNHAE